MPESNPLVWLWLGVALATIILGTGNPVLLVATVVALVMTGAAAGGPRRAAFRLAVSAGITLAVLWAALTLVLAGDHGGTLLWQRPAWAATNGIALGGPLTITGLTDGVVGAMRAVAVVLVLGVLGQVVGGARWHALAASLLGGLAPLVAPICRLGDAAAATEVEVARARTHGRRTGGMLRSGLLRRAAELAELEPAPRAQVLRVGPHDVPAVLAAAVLTGCWLLRTSLVLPSELEPAPGTWGLVPLPLVATVLTVPLAVMVAVSLTGRRDRAQPKEVAHDQVG
ncbi:hypothetical protein GCM10028820_24930 [Tessaracoccus terricola]